MLLTAQILLGVGLFAMGVAICATIRSVIHDTQLLGDRSDQLSDGGGEVTIHDAPTTQTGVRKNGR
jgi:hypothetical protein